MDYLAVLDALRRDLYAAYCAAREPAQRRKLRRMFREISGVLRALR